MHEVSQTVHVLLTTAKCGYFHQSAANSSRPNVVYSGLPIEGAMANFSCPPGMVLNGTNTTTCMGNGEWKPDPQDFECICESLN